MIRSITFGHNCICITKNEEEDLLFQERDYRFKFKHNILLRILESTVPKIIIKKFNSDPLLKQKAKDFLIKFGILN